MPKKLDDCQKQVYQRFIDKYREKYGKGPSTKRLKEFEDSSWAICQKSVGGEIIDDTGSSN